MNRRREGIGECRVWSTSRANELTRRTIASAEQVNASTSDERAPTARANPSPFHRKVSPEWPIASLESANTSTRDPIASIEGANASARRPIASIERANASTERPE